MLTITFTQKIKSILLDLGKLIPMLLLVCSGSASGQVLPCDSLSTDASWEIVGVAPGAVFCTSTAIELIVRTDSTYNEDFLSYQWQRKEGAGSFANIVGATNDTLNTTLTSTAQFQCIVTCDNGDTGDNRTIGPITLTITIPTAGAISGAQTICNGGDPAAFTNTTSGSSATSATVSYKWQSQTGAGGFTDISGATQPTFNPPSGLTQTTAYRRITRSSDSVNSECLSAPTAAVTVTVQGVISPGTISGNQTICSGGDPSILNGNNVASTGGATIAYQWEQSTNNVNFSEISGAVSNSFDPPTLTANTFYRRITESTLNGVLCSSGPSDTVQVTVRALPNPGSISDSQTICFQGDPLPFTSITAGTSSDGGVISYRWEVNTNSPLFPAGSWATTTTGTGATTAVFEEANNTLTSNRQYRRFAISTLNALACTSATATGTVQLTVQPQLTASFAENTATVCVGQTAVLTVNGTAGAIVTYTVDDGADQVVLLNASGAGSISVPTSAAGNIDVLLTQIQATSPVTCTRSLDVPASITVISLPTASFSSGNASTHCLASTYSLQLSGTANASVSYNLNGGSTQSATLSSSGSVTISGIALGIGSNTFQLTQVSLGSCSATLLETTFNVNVTSNPSVSVVALNGDDFLICPNESVTLGSNTVGTAYQWFRNGVLFGTSAEITTSQTGNYSVQVTAGGCGGTSPAITISQAQVPVATITADGPTTFCAEGSVSISSTVNSCTGCELLWSTQSVANSISVSENAVITLTATNDDGCSDTSNSITVIENPLPNVGVTASANTICDGATAELTATGATSYSWVNVGSGQSAGNGAIITVGVSGVYRVTGTTTTSGVSCSNMDEEEIVVLATPELQSITGPPAVCANSSAQIILQGSDDATVSYRINGGTIQTVDLDGNGQAILFSNPNFTGNSLVYTPVSIALGDCQGTVSGSVSVQINPRPILEPIADVEYCNGQDIIDIALNEAGNSQVTVLGYDWESFPDVLFGDDPAFGSITGEVINTGINPIVSEFTVWGTSQAGCISDSVLFVLTANPGPIISEIADITLCDGDEWQTINLDAGLSGADISWESVGPDIGLAVGANSAQIIAAGNQGTVNIPDGNSGFQTQTITVNAQAGGCGAAPMSFNVNVLSKPIGTTAATWAFCRGNDIEISFSATIDDTYFDWQVVEDSDFIGLPAGGDSAVDSVSFTTVNDQVIELSAAIAITPMVTDTVGSSIRTCVGSAQNVVVIVNPTPQLAIESIDAFCFQDSLLDSDFEYTFTPESEFVSYTWQVSNTGLFEPDGGNDAIATQANNPLTDQVVSNVLFTPVYDNHGRSCSGNTQTVSVTVLPQPAADIDFTSTDFTLCSGESIVFDVSSPTTPASTWIVAAASTGVSGFETSCADCLNINDQLVLNGSTPGTVIYTVSPAIEGCTGNNEAFEYTVNPLPAEPQLTSNESSTWCAGAQGVILFADTTADVVRYDWTSIPDEWNPTYGGTINAIDGSQIYLDVPAAGGTINYMLTATNEYQCSTSGSFSLTVDAGTSLPDYDVVIVNQGTDNQMLAVIPAIDGQTYQWGALNQSDWSASTFNGETAQVIFLDASFNQSAQYYYVDVTNGDCVSRVFFNSPNTLIPQSISEEIAAMDMHLFPNPFRDRLQLTKSNHTAATQLTIVDAMGRTVHAAQVPAYQENYTIDTNAWAAGTYFLRAVSGNTLVSTTLIKL